MVLCRETEPVWRPRLLWRCLKETAQSAHATSCNLSTYEKAGSLHLRGLLSGGQGHGQGADLLPTTGTRQLYTKS